MSLTNGSGSGRPKTCGSFGSGFPALPSCNWFFYRQENLAAQLAKIELAQQKRDEKAAEKAAKVLEVWFAILFHFLALEYGSDGKHISTLLVHSGEEKKSFVNSTGTYVKNWVRIHLRIQ